MPEELVGPEHRRIRNAEKILKENQELYDRIFDQMTEGQTRLIIGRTQTVMKALVHYFPPEMAEIVVHLTHEPKKAEQVAAESGKPLEYVQDMLYKYWRSSSHDTKAVIEEKGYSAPHGFGFSEIPFCDGLGGTYKYFDEDEEREVGLLLSKIYFEEGWLYQWGAEKQPNWQVLVDERQVDDPNAMADWEKGSEHIRQVKNVAITRCGCRVRHGAYNNCSWVKEKPMIDTCLQFDALGEPYVDRGGAKWATKADALDVLWYGLDAGLVSTASPVVDIASNARFICQCCPDCCHLIGPWARNRVTGAGVHRSNFDPRTDLKKCTCSDCGGDAACIKACPVPGVRFYHPPTKRDKSDEFIGVDTRRCWGCGLCAGACPEKAIKMVKVRNWVPATAEAKAKAGRHEFVDNPPAL